MDTNWQEKIEKVLAIRFGAMAMIVSTNDGYITEGAILQRDEAIKEINTILESLLSSHLSDIREKCRQIYIDGADWAEWGMSEEEAGIEFDKKLEIALLQDPNK